MPGISLNPAAIARNKKTNFDSHQISDTVAGWRQALNIHFCDVNFEVLGRGQSNFLRELGKFHRRRPLL